MAVNRGVCGCVCGVGVRSPRAEPTFAILSKGSCGEELGLCCHFDS